MKRLLSGTSVWFALSALLAGCGQTRLAPAPAAPPSAPSPTVAAAGPAAQVFRVPVEDVAVRGPADALVTIVEFGDVECPYCRQLDPTLRRIEQEYAGKVRRVWRHRVVSSHPNAGPGAMTAEAARAAKGDAAFWKVIDALLERPLDPAAVNRAGAEVGLDPAAVARDEAGISKMLERIRRDHALAFELGVDRTPTLFVNGRKLVGARPYEALKPIVDEELARAEAMVRSGVASREVYARIIERGITQPVKLEPADPPAVVADVPLRPDGPARGPASAPVTIAVFSDYECPFCSQMEPRLAKLEQEHPGKIRIVLRHLPLPFHPNALAAAKAAEAARAQGKFWEMHAKLFEGQKSLSRETYLRLAEELGLDVPRFERDLASDAVARRVAEDAELAAKVGATGTPTLYVNCRKMVGAGPEGSLRSMLAEELAKAEALAKLGRRPAEPYAALCADNVAKAPRAPEAGPRTDVKVALRSDDPARGTAAARVTVVAFSDFQCPFCARALPELATLERELGREVRVVWKHLPLPMHPDAIPAALAAEAARAQGKFWEMHDRLFEGQADLSDAALVRHARALGLDLARFDADRQAAATRARVEADLAAASAAGIDGTPTFVVNGEVVVGAGGLRAAVDRQLRRAKLAVR